MEIVIAEKDNPRSTIILSSYNFNKTLQGLREKSLNFLDLNLKFGLDPLYQRIENLIIAIRDNTSLTSLILNNNDITDDQAIRILDGIQNNRNLKILNLNKNKIEAEGAKAIAETIKRNPNLQTFDISSNNIKDDGARAIAEAINENRTLELLNFSNTQIGDLGARDIAEAIKQNPNLQTFDISSNNIGDDGARAIAEAIKQNPNLTSLNLSYNQIGAQGARAIAEVIEQNPNLTSLDLSNNNIGDDGARAIAEAIKQNPNLTSLNLSNNNIGPKGARAIAEAIKQNTNLTSLNMDDNKLGDEGASFLAGGISINKDLINLSLSKNNIGTLGFSRIIAGINNKTNSININLNSNIIGGKKSKAYNDEMKELYFNFRALWDKESVSELNSENRKCIFFLEKNPLVEDWMDILDYKRSSYNKNNLLTNIYKPTSGGYKTSNHLNQKHQNAKTKIAHLDNEFDYVKSARGGFASALASGGPAEEPEQTAEESRPFPNFGAELIPLPEQQLEGFGEPHENSDDEFLEPQILYADPGGSSDGADERIEEMQQELQQSIWNSLHPQESEESPAKSGRVEPDFHKSPSNGGHRGESLTGFGGSANGSAGKANRPFTGGIRPVGFRYNPLASPATLPEKNDEGRRRRKASTGLGGSANGSAGKANRPFTGGIRPVGFRYNPLASPATLPEKNDEGRRRRKASTGFGGSANGSAGKATQDEIDIANSLLELSALHLIPEDSNGERKASTGLGGSAEGSAGEAYRPSNGGRRGEISTGFGGSAEGSAEGSAGEATPEKSLEVVFEDDKTCLMIFKSSQPLTTTQKQLAIMYQLENLSKLKGEEGSSSVEGKRPGGQPVEGRSGSLHEITYEDINERKGRKKPPSRFIEIYPDGKERMICKKERYNMRQTPARISANAAGLQRISPNSGTEKYQGSLVGPSTTSSDKASRPNPSPENPQNPKNSKKTKRGEK